MNGNERISVESGKPTIRGIPVHDIYRNLAFGRMTEEELFREHPGLTPEDLAAVREHVVAEIKSRTHDEFTGRPILPKDQLRHGAVYKGRCRNACLARWNDEQHCFYHWREKFEHIYIETIKYPTDEVEPWWDVFDVVEELPNPKIEIPFDESAEYHGNRDDLYEFHEEMWHRPKK